MTRVEYLERAHALAKRGSDLPQSKLTEGAVREIRRNPRGWTARQWADHLGLHIRTIEAVQQYRRWGHVR